MATVDSAASKLDRAAPKPAIGQLIQVRMRPDRRAGARDSLVRQLLVEFEQKPALIMTERQAARLFGIPTPACVRILTVLVADGKLRMTPDGRYRSRVDRVA